MSCGSSAIVPLWVVRGSLVFSRGYFVGPQFLSWVVCGTRVFLVGISWVSIFFLWVFHESPIFSCGYFAGSTFSVMGNFVFFWCLQHEKK